MTYSLHATDPHLGEDIPVSTGELADLVPLAGRLLDAGIVTEVRIVQGSPPALTPRQQKAREIVEALLDRAERP